jgi:thiol-disulfide isomerase/thioredoxin
MHSEHQVSLRRILRECLVALLTPALFYYAACDDVPSRRRASATEAPAPAPAPAPPSKPSEIESIDAPALFAYMRTQGKRGTVVNVWASWCGSCRGEVPMLLQLREAFAAEGLDFLFVSADVTADFPKAIELMQSWSAPLPTFAVAGAMTPFKRAMHPTWKGAIPATFLFDDTQKLRHFWEGPILEHEIAPILQGFLAGEAIDGETRPLLMGE